jgi:pectate lyase-like protein
MMLTASGVAVPAQTPGVYDLIKDFGADPTGATDSTAAVQSFFSAITNGQVGLIPQGTYSLTSTISVYLKVGIRVSGLGPATTGQTIFRWDGASGGIVFALNQVETSYFTDFSITSGAGGIGVCMDTDNIAPIVQISSDNRYRDISCNGSTIAGFRFSHQSTQNNDMHYLTDVSVQCNGGRGISIENHESKFNLIRDGFFANCDVGIAVNPFGSIHAWNPRFMSNKIDLQLEDPYDTIALYHPVSVGSQQLLMIGGETEAPWPVLVENGDFDVSDIPAGTNAIQNLGPGPLVLKGNNFHTSNAGAASTFAVVDYTFGSGGGLSSIGNTYPGGSPFQGNGNLVSIGDVFNGATSQTPAPIVTGPVLTARPSSQIDSVNGKPFPIRKPNPTRFTSSRQ